MLLVSKFGDHWKRAPKDSNWLRIVAYRIIYLFILYTIAMGKTQDFAIFIFFYYYFFKKAQLLCGPLDNMEFGTSLQNPKSSNLRVKKWEEIQKEKCMCFSGYLKQIKEKEKGGEIKEWGTLFFFKKNLGIFLSGGWVGLK